MKNRTGAIPSRVCAGSAPIKTSIFQEKPVLLSPEPFLISRTRDVLEHIYQINYETKAAERYGLPTDYPNKLYLHYMLPTNLHQQYRHWAAGRHARSHPDHIA